MNFSFLSLSPKLLIVTALLLIGIPVTIFLMSQQQNLQQQAWSTDQSATAICDTSTGKIVIEARFTNTEANGAANAMNVKAKDSQSGNEVDLGTVNPGETKRGNITTDNNSTSGGNVTFFLTWTNGQTGTDTRTAGYGSAGPCQAPTDVPPTPSSVQPSNTPIPPSVTPKPTNTPVPPTSTPIPTGTTVPSNTPVPSVTLLPSITPTPTDIPPTQVLPTPTGTITGCPVPTKVQNIKIICPFCNP